VVVANCQPGHLSDNRPVAGRKAWGRKSYFADFTQDVGEGYIGNNLGQDLRNFQRFLHYAKSQGSTTVYFSYG
jgi:hypothetical protein